MALRLLVRYSFWIRAASRGSYTSLDGLGCRCRFGCGPDRDGPFWGAFGVFSPWPSVAKRMKASRNASRPSKSSSAIRSSSALHFCYWTLPLVGSGRGSSAESRCLTSMSSCLVSGTFVGKGLVHYSISTLLVQLGLVGSFVRHFAVHAGFPVGPVGVVVKDGPVVVWQQDSAMW